MIYRMMWFISFLFLILPVIGVTIMWVRKLWSGTTRIVLTVLFAIYIIILVIVLMPSGDKTADEQTETEQHTQEEQAEEEQEKTEAEQKDRQEKEEEKQKKEEAKKSGDPKEQFKRAFDNVSSAKLLHMTGAFDQEPYTMEIVFRGAERSTKASAVKSMREAILEAVYVVKDAVYEVDDLAINVTYPLSKENDQKEDQFAIKSDFSGTAIDELPADRTNVDVEKLTTIADSWWQHPVLSDS